MTAPSTADAERLYQFLVEYIAAHKYSPRVDELERAMPRRRRELAALLTSLEQQGRIRISRNRHRLAIVLIDSAQSANGDIVGKRVPLPILARPSLVTVERAIDWKRMLKEFRGVAIARITVKQIGHYYQKRCRETGHEQAEREANLLLGLRFPELFLERRQKLDLSGFDDRQHPKRGCRSCGAKFTKLRLNQLYCSARCRAREKRHRRQATPQGKLLKSQQNKRYQDKHQERERERRQQWRLAHPRERRTQRDRELARRSLRSGWNLRRFAGLPAAVAAVIGQHGAVG